ncbi:MAG: PAS domain S-box protein [Anaerolineae bacterium]|nr:PAS domain S-box protein [Anaerolineae bacterium]
MNAQSIPAIAIASITFYVGLYHLLIYFRRKQHREDLTFALLCLATGFYAVFCSGLYNAVSVAEGAQWQRVQFIALAFLTTAFLWFVSDYTGEKPGIVTYAFSAYYLLVVIVQSVDRSALTWLVDQPAIKAITLPLLGYQIVYYEATLGPFTAVQGLVGLAASTYILWISVRFYRRGYQRETVPLLLALGCMYAAALNDTLVSQGAYQFIYAIEYGYLAMILLMAYSLSSTVVEAAMAKEALRQSEARWQFALEGSGDGVWDWNAQTNQVYFSRQWKAMLGFAEHEIGDTLAEWDTRIYPDDRDYVYEEIRKHLEGEAPLYISEHRLQCKDGTYKWILDRGQVIERTKDGKPLRVIGTHSDITGRRQTEAALRESEEKYRSIVENALVGIFMVDDAYHFTYVNDELGRILHYSSEELAGMDFRHVLSDESRAFVADYYIRRRRGEQLPSRYELSVLRQDGQVRQAEMSVTVVRDAAGQLRTMGQLVDITERKQAEASLARRATELRKLYEASLDINAQLDMTTLLHRVVEHGAALIGALQGSLYLLRPDQTLELVVLHNLPVDYLGARLKLGEGIAGRAVQEGKPMMVEDYQSWEGRSPVFDKLGARRVLSVPLKARNYVIGTLNVTDTEQPGIFSEDEIRLLSLFADQATVTIENTRLYEEAQHRAEYLATTNEISRAISTLQNLDSVLEVIYHQVQRTVPADAFYIGLYDAERNQVSFPIVYDLGVRYHEPDVTLGPDTWLAYVLRTGQPFTLHRSAEELQSPMQASLGDKSRKSASILIVPLWQKERVAGVLSVQSYTMNAYNNRHAEILTGVGVQAIIAIENARLFTAAQQELEERKRIQAELETKNAELERFAYTVSHDLKSPLITIGGFVGFLERDALLGDIARVKADVAHINDALAKMQELLDELLELSRIGRIINPPEVVSFEAIACEAVEAVRGRIEARDVMVEITPDLPIIYGDRARLVEVVQNLLDNACKFMGDQPQPRVEIGARQDQGQMILYVRDNGMGIEPQYHDQIFGLFDKLDPQSEGTGVGLALAKRIVETHGGKIWVESQPGQGATFCLTLPSSSTRQDNIQ